MQIANNKQIKKIAKSSSSAASVVKKAPRFIMERDLTPSILRCIEREESSCLYSRLLRATFILSGFCIFLIGWRLHCIADERNIFGTFSQQARLLVADAGIHTLSPSSLMHLAIIFHKHIPLIEISLFLVSIAVWTFVSHKIVKLYRGNSYQVPFLRARHD